MCKNAIDDQLDDARAVLDAFHVVAALLAAELDTTENLLLYTMVNQEVDEAMTRTLAVVGLLKFIAYAGVTVALSWPQATPFRQE